MKYWSGLALHKKIFVMLLLGIVVGWVAGPKAEILQPLGDVFIRLLRHTIERSLQHIRLSFSLSPPASLRWGARPTCAGSEALS